MQSVPSHDLVDAYLRVMIAAFFHFSIPYGAFGAPIDTSIALFASMQKGWLFLDHLDVLHRTDLLADAASIAGAANDEVLVRSMDLILPLDLALICFDMM